MCPFLFLVDGVALSYHIAMKNKLNVLLLTPMLLASCALKPIEETQTPISVLAFGSFFTCKYMATSGEAGREIFDFVTKVDMLADPYTDYMGVSNLYRINGTHEAVKVDQVLFELIKQSVDLKEKTEGNFNPFMGKITSLWKTTLFGAEYDLDFTGPTASSINEAKALIPALLEEMNGTNVELDEANLTVKRIGDGYIDLGGLTKGYSVEKVERILERYNVSSYLVNGGQSSLGLGKGPNGGPFKVNLMYSKEENENSFSLSEIDTSTSAIYEQFATVDGVTYSHIINPNTGLPLTDYSMAFLSGEDSALLDAFSTSCMIAGPEKSEEWAKKYNFTYSLYSDEGGFTKLVAESDELTKARI